MRLKFFKSLRSATKCEPRAASALSQRLSVLKNTLPRSFVSTPERAQSPLILVGLACTTRSDIFNLKELLIEELLIRAKGAVEASRAKTSAATPRRATPSAADGTKFTHHHATKTKGQSHRRSSTRVTAEDKRPDGTENRQDRRRECTCKQIMLVIRA